MLFGISSTLWIFFSEHFIWLKRFEVAANHGVQAPSSFLGFSKVLAMLTMFNLLAFFFVYGFKVSWLWSMVIVIGGHAAALLYVVVTRSMHGMFIHKLGWLGMPILSIYLWYVAFSA